MKPTAQKRDRKTMAAAAIPAERPRLQFKSAWERQGSLEQAEKLHEAARHAVADAAALVERLERESVEKSLRGEAVGRQALEAAQGERAHAETRERALAAMCAEAKQALERALADSPSEAELDAMDAQIEADVLAIEQAMSDFIAARARLEAALPVISTRLNHPGGLQDLRFWLSGIERAERVFHGAAQHPVLTRGSWRGVF